MKRFITLIITLLPMLCFSLTRQVALDGSQAYTSIQAAINDAMSGDTILVHPGRYIENIDLREKSGLILASLEYTTADPDYIDSTIIDGSGANSSTILCYENVNNCTIRGFSITGGKGYDFYQGSIASQIFGGGIFIYRNNSIILNKLNIFGNRASIGGGISIVAPNSVHLSEVNIYDNFARYHGGGLAIGSAPYIGAPEIVFSQTDRCSIYNNFAQWGMDIHWHYIHGGTLSVYLKKFTVSQWEKYYASYYDSTYPPSPYTVFDIQEAYLQPLDADLYVSPYGDDTNDGLSPATALKTPSRAMQRIASNPDNPKTVHLMAGVHHNLIGGEYIPISIKDYTILQGVSEAETSLYGENMLEGTGVISMGIESYGMTMKDFSITTSHASAIFSWGVYDCLIENLSIVDSTVDRWLFNVGFRYSTITLKNITMNNNTGFLSEFGLNLRGGSVIMDNITMTNSRTESFPQSEFDRHCGGFDIEIYDSLIIRNSKFVNNTHYSEEGTANFRVVAWEKIEDEYIATVDIDNCLFAHNQTYNGARDYRFTGYIKSLNITNCTFANNTGTNNHILSIGSQTTRIINSIFSDNSAFYDIYTGSNTFIENCLFTKSSNFCRTWDHLPVVWGINNLTGTNPMFSGSDPTLASYYHLFCDDLNGYSPAIDAGTMDPSILPLGYTIPQYDAFGNNRVYGAGIDIGCYESQGYTGNEEEVYPSLSVLKLSNYPNPFNPSTTISFEIPNDTYVNLDIYNAKGQLVKRLVNSFKAVGKHSVMWDGRDDNGNKASSGIYFTKIVTDTSTLTSKMLMLK